MAGCVLRYHDRARWVARYDDLLHHQAVGLIAPVPAHGVYAGVYWQAIRDQAQSHAHIRA